MNCLKLRFPPLVETCGDYWMTYPAQLLRIIRRLSSDCNKQEISLNLFQQSVISPHQTNEFQQFRCQNSKKGTHQLNNKILFATQNERMVQASDVDITDCVSSSMHRNIEGFHVLDRHSLSQTVIAPRWCPKLPDSIFVCDRHFLRAPWLRVTAPSVPLPFVSSNFSLSSPLKFKGAVRFYRGQTRSQAFNKNTMNQDLEKEDGNVLDESEGDCGNIDEMSYKLSAASNIDADSGDSDFDAAEEPTQVAAIQEQRNVTVRRKPADEMTLPELSRTSFNIVPYVKRSVTLQNLVRLGVNLDKVQKVAGVAEYLIKADFDRDIVPFLNFLTLVGVESNMIGHIFTANPLLFKESIQDLELRIGCLLHKNFSLREIASIITKGPVVLLMDPIMLDDKLAFLLNVFNLTAREVREVVKLYPKILPWRKELLAEVKFHVKEFMGFTDSEIRQLILKRPKIFVSGKGALVSRFDYLHNHMLISHQHILTWPNILTSRLFIFKNRHLFLLYRDQAQYDPYKENYVSLKALASGTDEEFCQIVPKCHVQEFYNFCKTL